MATGCWSQVFTLCHNILRAECVQGPAQATTQLKVKVKQRLRFVMSLWSLCWGPGHGHCPVSITVTLLRSFNKFCTKIFITCIVYVLCTQIFIILFLFAALFKQIICSLSTMFIFGMIFQIVQSWCFKITVGTNVSESKMLCPDVSIHSSLPSKFFFTLFTFILHSYMYRFKMF